MHHEPRQPPVRTSPYTGVRVDKFTRAILELHRSGEEGPCDTFARLVREGAELETSIPENFINSRLGLTDGGFKLWDGEVRHLIEAARRDNEPLSETAKRLVVAGAIMSPSPTKAISTRPAHPPIDVGFG